MNEQIPIRRLVPGDCVTISEAFAEQGWDKPSGQFQNYLAEQTEGKREVFVAEIDREFAGYVTLLWLSKYPPFLEKNIPEVCDLNVLIKFRNRGTGSALLEVAERIASKQTTTIGIGVGLTDDYGDAQRLYVNRGYIPDGRGVSQNGTPLEYGDKVTVDDDLNLYFIKTLTRP